MAASIGSRPLVVHEVTQGAIGVARSVSGFDLRSVGLRIVADLLGMPVGDLDHVRTASDLGDTGSCPVYGPHPRWTT